MIYFIAYDISDDKMRTNVAHTLEEHGTRIHYSVFQCELRKHALKELLDLLIPNIDTKYDSLHIYPICKDCFAQKYELGQPSTEDDSSITIL